MLALKGEKNIKNKIIPLDGLKLSQISLVSVRIFQIVDMEIIAFMFMKDADLNRNVLNQAVLMFILLKVKIM